MIRNKIVRLLKWVKFDKKKQHGLGYVMLTMAKSNQNNEMFEVVFSSDENHPLTITINDLLFPRKTTIELYFDKKMVEKSIMMLTDIINHSGW